MKGKWVIGLLAAALLVVGCGSLKRAAAKYWTKKQIEQFLDNCEAKAGPFVGAEKAANYCDCAVDIVAEEYQNYSDVEKLSIREIVRLAKSCSEGA